MCHHTNNYKANKLKTNKKYFKKLLKNQHSPLDSAKNGAMIKANKERGTKKSPLGVPEFCNTKGNRAPPHAGYSGRTAEFEWRND